MSNSVIGFLSGTVTYSDNSSNHFHTQINSKTEWNMTDDAKSVLADATMFSGECVSSIINNIPGISDIALTPYSVSDKTPTDVIIHLSLVITIAETTTPVSATFENGIATFHVLGILPIDESAIAVLLDLLNNVYLNPAINNPGQIRIVDNTGDNTPKRALIFSKNRALSTGHHTLAWYDLSINNNVRYFNFTGTLYARATYGSVNLENVELTVGRKYSVTTSTIIDIGAAGSVHEIDIINNTGVSTTVTISRNGNDVEIVTYTNGVTKSFDYRVTVWVHVLTDLDLVLTPAACDALIPDVNTEISFLGVAAADLVITKENGIYSYSLTNISFS